MKSNRTFHWLSSNNVSNEKELVDLNSKLGNFYSELASRTQYNIMIKGDDAEQPVDEVTKAFINWFKTQPFENILEVGCGTGRIRKHLPLKVKPCQYTGTEVSAEVIDNNRKKWPENNWFFESVYDLTFSPGQFDLVFSFYVLEHLVFPEKALEKMFQLVKPGGSISLIFPDFVSTKRLPSQFIGLGFDRSAKEKLSKARTIDALVSLYDSRVRLKNALEKVGNSPGSFTINANPVCLFYPGQHIWPDFDAVYIAHKKEIAHWAASKGMEVTYPAGTGGLFAEHAFMVLKKPI